METENSFEQETPLTTQEHFDEGKTDFTQMSDEALDTALLATEQVEQAPALEFTGDAMVAELQYGTEAEMTLHLHLSNTETPALDDTGAFTQDTIDLALATGMSQELITQHQESVYAQRDIDLQKIQTDFDANAVALNLTPQYARVVVDWALHNLNEAEVSGFDERYAQNPQQELKALEKYYISEVNK